MKSLNISAKKPAPAIGALPEQPGVWSRWQSFWFEPGSPLPWEIFRTLSGLAFLTTMLLYLGHQNALLGANGWLDIAAFKQVDAKEVITDTAHFPVPPGWSVFFLAGDDRATLTVLYGLGIVVVALFTLGIATRVTSVLTWIYMVSYSANPVAAFEADFLYVILAFYLMIGSLWQGWLQPMSPVERILGPRPLGLLTTYRGQGTLPRSYALHYALRMFQIHFAIIVFTSAVHKFTVPDWWSGTAFWYSLHAPMATTIDDIRAMQPYGQGYLVLLSLAAYPTWAWQLTLPLFAWREGAFWRTLLLGGGVLAWIGSMGIFGLPIFGPFYFIGCLSYPDGSFWTGLWNKLVARE